MPILKALVFDFDGTLIESADIKTQAFASLFRPFPGQVHQIVQYHLENAGISRYVKFRKIYRDILKQPLSQTQEELLAESFRNLVIEKMAECPLVDGTREFLSQVAKQYACFIASGTPEEELGEIVKLRGLSSYFQGIYGSPRTKAEIIRAIRLQYGFNVSEMVFIGDAISDHQASAKEGISFVGRVLRGQKNSFPIDTTVMVFETLAQLKQEWGVLLERLQFGDPPIIG